MHGLVEHLFRRSAAGMVAALTRILGPDRMDRAEDVVQEALLQALRVWPYRGVPENPAGWLVHVARNRALDVLRRDASRERRVAELEEWARAAAGEARAGLGGAQLEEPLDDALRMIFTCCHPALGPQARVALTLKSLCGFGTAEIARAFLTGEATVAQRLVRAKRRIREEGIPFTVPEGEELTRRLDSVLEVIYLVFNEGYGAHQGGALVRRELVEEALRLGALLARAPELDRPKVHALLALMLLAGARLPARVGALGDLLTLEEQDRSLWDQSWIQRGFAHFERSIAGEELTPYHVQAAIAAAHASAPRFEDTDWARILALYDQLLALEPSPVAALNRAVALAMARGCEAGLAELDPLAGEPALAGYHLFPATRGELLRRLGRRREAAAALRDALALPCTAPERALLLRRLAACERDAADPAERTKSNVDPGLGPAST